MLRGLLFLSDADFKRLSFLYNNQRMSHRRADIDSCLAFVLMNENQHLKIAFSNIVEMNLSHKVSFSMKINSLTRLLVQLSCRLRINVFECLSL